MRTYTAILMLFIFLSPAFAQYEVSVTTINVWIKATDKSGTPVPNLKQEDFQLFEDGQPMQSTCFEEVTLPIQTESTVEQAPTELPEIPEKQFVIFLDLYNISQPELLYIKPKLLDFIHRFAGSHREIMLAGVRSDRNMGVFSPFTEEEPKLESLIQQAQGNVLRDRDQDNNDDNLRSTLANYTAKGGLPEAIRQGYLVAEGFARQEAEVAKFSLDALERFGNYLAKQNQKQHSILIYVSGGFSMDPGRHYFDIVDTFADDHRESNYQADQTIYRQPVSFDFRRLLQASIGKMNRLNITVYSINARGLILSDPDASKDAHLIRRLQEIQSSKEYGDSLAVIAEDTGGISFSNSQNFKLGFNHIIQDLDHQYLLCYSAPEHKEHDKYHKITLKVNRPDVEVRFRDGYLD